MIECSLCYQCGFFARFDDSFGCLLLRSYDISMFSPAPAQDSLHFRMQPVPKHYHALTVFRAFSHNFVNVVDKRTGHVHVFYAVPGIPTISCHSMF